LQETDHDDEYADALLETRNLIQYKDVQCAKQVFDNSDNKGAGYKTSFKSWMKGLNINTRGRRYSSYDGPYFMPVLIVQHRRAYAFS
jgi:hypothetical protein